MLASEKVALAVFVGAISGIYLLEFLSLLKILLRRVGVLPRRKRRKALRVTSYILHIISALGIICMVYAYFIEPYWIEVVEVEVPAKRLNNMELTIVQISDLHCDCVRRNEDEVVKLVNNIQPDVIVFTGDAVNNPDVLPVFRDTLRRLEARLGKFAVRGNFDTSYSRGELVGETGFKLLERDVVVLKDGDESFCIAGVSCRNHDRVREVLAEVPTGMFCVFLHHYPHIVEDLPQGVVDLSLCGHIHGGQVALPFYGAIITLSPTGKKYERGTYDVNGTLLYVNRGIGMEGGTVPRVRFCARPEITVFKIRPAK